MRFPTLLLALALVLGGASVAQAGSPPAVNASDRVLGRADAPVTVIEYASFVCPHCAEWHNDVLPQFKSRFIDTGKVKLVFRNLPTAPAAEAYTAAAIGRCAAPGRFFDVSRSLFVGQAGLLAGDGTTWFRNAVAASGRTEDQIRACFADPATKSGLDAEIQGAITAGVTGTPSFFVNGVAVADISLAGLSTAITAAGN